MKHGINSPRPLSVGMGEAVARRTILRKKNIDDTYQTKQDMLDKKPFKWETWGEVARRVAEGSISTIRNKKFGKKSQKINLYAREQLRLEEHIANGSILMSGRHLQHGDKDQYTRNIEVFSNCSSASTSFMKFYLLLNGSGVGRCYDDDLMVVDWSKQPFIHVVLDETHPDYDYTCMESLQQVQHKYGKYGITVFKVQDSREGWAKALEHLENLIFEGTHENDIVVYDFSQVRPEGSLIGGMQMRPSAGPVPTMNAFNNVKSLKGCKTPKWWQSMYVDHYLADSVLVGGARRSARIAVKHWRDPDILDFINLKKSWTLPDVLAKDGTLIRKGRKVVPLWSANNSVGVDDEFWAEHLIKGSWANIVFEAVCAASYHHGTGEPGLVNLHKLEANKKDIFKRRILGSERYQIYYANELVDYLAHIMGTKKFFMVPNPCGEITLYMHGAYCVIGDVAPYHCDTLDECEEAIRLTTRTLIRTNMLDCVYKDETKRTNRIGVALTGIHEFAWKFFKIGFEEISRPLCVWNADFWNAITRLSLAVRDESIKCAAEYNVEIPHTCLTIKPSGTTSKLFGLSEGAHLPSMKEYLRWVQFRSDDPLIKKYSDIGYMTKALKQYEGTTVVGFPTQPTICTLGMGDKLITAPEATMEEQFQWVKNLEHHWLRGGIPDATWGNQVSYTLKYDRKVVSFEQYKEQISKHMQDVRCCSVMPTSTDMDESEYEYLPEEPVSLRAFNDYVGKIKSEIEQDIDKVHIDCAGGSCPVDFNKE